MKKIKDIIGGFLFWSSLIVLYVIVWFEERILKKKNEYLN